MDGWSNEWNGVIYTDPRSELRDRAQRARESSDPWFAVPTELVWDALNVRECEERTVVNGNRQDQVLIEVKCTRLVDPITGEHKGDHVNGRTSW
jgi:hypothetical protein